MACDRPSLALPDSHERLLLHSCCAPCAGEVMEGLVASKVNFQIYFYNPNIHPQKEYELRKAENIRFANKLAIPFIDADYDPKHWFAKAAGMEHEPERGVRCSMCFEMRLAHTARYAQAHGFSLIATVLGISRWKNLPQIDAAGQRAVANCEGVSYWDKNWRKAGGSSRMLEVSKRETFYQQEYCGCAYSLRDTNRSRIERGLDRIHLGTKFYQAKEALGD